MKSLSAKTPYDLNDDLGAFETRKELAAITAGGSSSENLDLPLDSDGDGLDELDADRADDAELANTTLSRQQIDDLQAQGLLSATDKAFFMRALEACSLLPEL